MSCLVACFFSFVCLSVHRQTSSPSPSSSLSHTHTHTNTHAVRALAKELRLGNASHYAPYVDYLLHALQNEEDDDYNTIPSRYSQPGQELVLQVTTGGSSSNGGPSDEERIPPVEAVSWIKEDWLQYCPNTDPNDVLSIQAAAAVLQRSDDALLIPGYDLYNHRNGKYTNTKTVVKAEQYYQVVASRTIVAGEELYNTYNFCDDCGGRKKNYGTPGTYERTNEKERGCNEHDVCSFGGRWIVVYMVVLFSISR
jgi:SET domain